MKIYHRRAIDTIIRTEWEYAWDMNIKEYCITSVHHCLAWNYGGKQNQTKWSMCLFLADKLTTCINKILQYWTWILWGAETMIWTVYLLCEIDARVIYRVKRNERSKANDFVHTSASTSAEKRNLQEQIRVALCMQRPRPFKEFHTVLANSLPFCFRVFYKTVLQSVLNKF